MTDLSKLKWTDTSTADPIEKARRVLNHLIEPDGAFFFQDGFPRSNDIAMNAASVLAVLNALSASIADTAGAKPSNEQIHDIAANYCIGGQYRDIIAFARAVIAATPASSVADVAVAKGYAFRSDGKLWVTQSLAVAERWKAQGFEITPVTEAAPSVADAAGASEEQAEPVAWRWKHPASDEWQVSGKPLWFAKDDPASVQPLYLHPSTEIAALRERIAGMEKDAERYRFLKARTERLDYDAGWRSCWRIESVDIPPDQPRATLDETIDAAIAKEPK